MPNTRTPSAPGPFSGPDTKPAGLPPVPIAVLLPPASHRRYVPAPIQTGDPTGLVLPTASRLVGIYTRPGDLVVDLHGTGTLATAAAQAGRHALTIVTNRDTRRGVQAVVEARLNPTQRRLASTLTAPATDPPDLPPEVAGRVRLLVTRLPRPGRRLSLRTAVRWLAACRHTLAEPGYLIVAVDATGPGGRYADHATTVIAAARASGLIYHQLLIVPTRPLPEPADPGQLPARLGPGQRHERIHADLYVFTTPEGFPIQEAGQDGQDEGGQDAGHGGDHHV